MLPDPFKSFPPTFPFIFVGFCHHVLGNSLTHYVRDAAPSLGRDLGQFFMLFGFEQDLRSVFISSSSHSCLQTAVYTYTYTRVNYPNKAINTIPPKITPAPSRRVPPIFSPRNFQPKKAPITTLTSRMASE